MSIRNKLIIYAFISSFFTLMVVGFLFDLVLTELYNNNAQTKLEYARDSFRLRVNSIEKNMRAQVLQSANNRLIVSTVSLVNRYQDKNNYQPLIFDNDKKQVADYLLRQISLSDSERAIIYGKNGELIAYALKKRRGGEKGIASFKNGKQIIIKSKRGSELWSEGGLPEFIPLKQAPLENKISFLKYSGEMVFRSLGNSFFSESNRVITRKYPDGKIEYLGIVKINKSFDAEFFDGVTGNKDTQLSMLLSTGGVVNNVPGLFPVQNLAEKSVLYTDTGSGLDKTFIKGDHYVKSFVWPTKAGKNYFFVTTSRNSLVEAINSTRIYLLYVFLATGVLAILIGVYWLNRLISKPLSALAGTARFTVDDDLPEFPVSKANDEISLLGTVLNNMVDTIKRRELSLRENEKELNSTQALAKIGGWRLEHATGKINWSKEVFNIFELVPNNCTPDIDTVAGLIYFDDLRRVQEAYEESLKSHRPYSINHRLYLASGSLKHVHVYVETSFDENGSPVVSSGTIQDITEQEIREEKLRRSQRMDAIGKLTGGIAHDFNNMLTVVLGFSELVKMSPGLEKQNIEHIDQVIQAGERARKLTAKLLAFSGKDSQDVVVTSINNVLRNEQHMLEKTLTARIELKLNLANKLWPVLLNADELEDSIINMCINAMHAMPAKGVLTLTTSNITLDKFDVHQMKIPAGDYVQLLISDTGIGMSDAVLQRVYEPFFTTKEDMGTGLGMSQVYGFVQRAKGDISICSELGCGTQIKLYFPRYIERDDVKKKSSIETLDDINEDLSGSGRILVVDDELALRELAEHILDENGYTVFVANCAEQALMILEREPMDLLISDVIMPSIDGYQLAEKVKELYPSLQIQMVSGFSEGEANLNVDSDLHTACLQKPYGSNLLLKRVKELLN